MAMIGYQYRYNMRIVYLSRERASQ